METTRRKPEAIADELRWTFRVADVAARSGLSESEIRQALAKGEFKGQRYKGRVWMIDPKEARAWLTRMCQPSAA